ncbi:unnamed protein product [Vitrella brassicaformis CCMP3155]|uniref:Uncharacterized protein n=1 Tax=Vitrella brassicaformis (strain CCMP3155) TaxID=1169540 RepID=A0A0G4GYJ8_VITBC|nr:unnamed protein product [Vitrella brassicaformis CCMP3155]|eukprot:CEM36227.1 unnamed protein product [Vitrella brassicaformis CCMP3155]
MGAATSSTSSSRPGCFAYVSLVTRGRQRRREGVPLSAVPAAVMPAIAQFITSYAGLCAFHRIDKTRHGALTPAVMLPILQRLLGVLLPSLGLGGLLVCVIPQLPLPAALSHGCCIACLVEQLNCRLFMLGRGGKWARWKPVLEILYHLRGKRPLVLSDGNFGVFGSRAAFMSEREAVRQWRILFWGVTLPTRIRHRLMDGDKICDLGDYSPVTLLDSARHFSRVFDPADPPTQQNCWTRPNSLFYPTYTSMVAIVLFRWLPSESIRNFRDWWSHCDASATSRRVKALLAASPGNAAKWGAGVAVFDRMDDEKRHEQRLVVLGSEVLGEGHMAVIVLRESRVRIYATESAPRDKMYATVMRILGDELGTMVWHHDRNWLSSLEVSPNTSRCTIM